jgi:hypothetical protein
MCWEKFPPFREDSVKLFESALSLVCYHCCRGLGECPVSLFPLLPENGATVDSLS